MLVLTRREGEWLEFTVSPRTEDYYGCCLHKDVTFRIKLARFSRDRANMVLDIPDEVQVVREEAQRSKPWPKANLIDSTKQRNQGTEVQDRARGGG